MYYSEQYVVFDIHGITRYPDFEKIVTSLEDRGSRIRFYSYGDPESVDHELNAIGMGKYKDKVIDGTMHDTFFKKMKRALTVEHLSRRLSSGMVRNALYELGAPYDDQNITRVLIAGKIWMYMCHYYGRYLKCPWVFGENVLHVESDGTYWSDENPDEVYLCPNHYAPMHMSAKRLGYSLLYVPEYPGIWSEYQPEVGIDQVFARMKECILNWNGELFTIQLGEQTGLYREWNYYHPERR